MNEQYQHPAFPKPAQDGIKIWRYMHISKFKWLIENQRLFMPVAYKLGDPLEGTEPTGNDVWWNNQLRKATTDRQKQIIKANQEKLSKFGSAFRGHYYVSCWHINENENNRMWCEYTQSKDSVAIQTNYKILRALLPKYLEIGVVRYIDYNNESLPSLTMFEYITHKHVDFCFERELRVVAFCPPVKKSDSDCFDQNLFEKEDDSKFRVFAPKIDIKTLVCGISFHPEASNPFKREIIEISERNSLVVPKNSLFDINNDQ